MIGLTVVAATMAFSSAPKIEDFGFMEGSWKCEIWGGTFEEHWTTPAGGAMQGMGRHLAGGKTSFMEYMSLESGPDGLTMYILLGAPSKGEKKPVPFKLKSFDGKTAMFENPKNDFPSVITYIRESNGMSCWIEGVQDGKKTREEFKFKQMGRI